MDWRTTLTFDPAKMGGKPCIRGMRITVFDVLDHLASYPSIEALLADFPDLTRQDITACLAYASETLRSVRTIPA